MENEERGWGQGEGGGGCECTGNEADLTRGTFCGLWAVIHSARVQRVRRSGTGHNDVPK